MRLASSIFQPRKIWEPCADAPPLAQGFNCHNLTNRIGDESVSNGLYGGDFRVQRDSRVTLHFAQGNSRYPIQLAGIPA